MSASQEDKLIDQLEDQIERLKAENDRLRDLIPQAWAAGVDRAIGAEVDFEQTYPSLEDWMEQKGLA